MSEKPNTEFNKIIKDPEPESSWAELQRSEEYAREDLYSTQHLEETGHYWQQELDNPSRSDRCKQDIRTILNRIGAELFFRQSTDSKSADDMLDPAAIEAMIKELELEFSE